MVGMGKGPAPANQRLARTDARSRVRSDKSEPVHMLEQLTDPVLGLLLKPLMNSRKPERRCGQLLPPGRCPGEERRPFLCHLLRDPPRNITSVCGEDDLRTAHVVLLLELGETLDGGHRDPRPCVRPHHDLFV